MIRVFSTNRAIREFYSGFVTQNTLLPKAITIAEFEFKAILVDDRVFIDEDSRFLLLREASKFDDFSILQFDSEFLTFINHSAYIFKFFDELASEAIEINDLRKFDTYALYDDHLAALEILKKRYVELLDKNNYIDRVNLSSHYRLNVDYLKNLEKVEIKLDGFLSNFEMKLIEECSKIVPLYVILELNRYNKKVKEIFEDIGFDLKKNYSYKLDISSGNIISQEPIGHKKLKADVKTFDTRISQVGSIFFAIDEFIKNGIRPQNIVVVLPDESIATFLKEFDTHKNLNFAMGFSLANSNIYRTIEAIELYLNSDKNEHKTRVKKLDIPQILLKNITDKFRAKIDPNSAIKILEELLNLDKNESNSDVYKEEIFRFRTFLLNLDFLSLEQIFRLFLKRIKLKSEDDVRGGMITVMGLLETRGCSFEGVIVPDFSDEYVPRRSQKDLFLNTQIRKNAGLPTKKDRESLQKYYYFHLFKNAKKVLITSVQNETTMPSRFLDELGLSYAKSDTSQNYNHILFKKRENFTPKVEVVEDLSYDLTKYSLSATKLNTLLTCRRKFYFKYIKKLQEPQNSLTSSNATLGLDLHKALQKVFSENFVFDDEKNIKKLLQKELLSFCKDDLYEFELQGWLVTLDKFIQNEKKRYANGYRVFGVERELSLNFEGFGIQGKIDRLDKKDGKLYVIDYKSGDIGKLVKQKIEYMTNFQLEFYYLLASDIGDVQETCYYDLKSGSLVNEPGLALKTDKLKEVLEEFREPIKSFQLCEKHSNCLYCPYKKLCLR